MLQHEKAQLVKRLEAIIDRKISERFAELEKKLRVSPGSKVLRAAKTEAKQTKK